MPVILPSVILSVGLGGAAAEAVLAAQITRQKLIQISILSFCAPHYDFSLSIHAGILITERSTFRKQAIVLLFLIVQYKSL
jgi:hypothetical protein